MPKLLLLRFSSIGDLVLTTPVIRALAKQTSYEIHLLTKKRFAPVLAHNPYLTKIYTFEQEVDEVLSYLKKERYSFLIDLHKNLRSFRVRLALGVKTYDFSKKNIEKWLMVQFKVNRLPEQHIVDRYFEAVLPLGVKNDKAGLDYFLDPEEQLLIDLPTSYLVIVLGAAHYTKQIPVHKIKEVIGQLSIPVVLIGGLAEAAMGKTIQQQFPRKVVNLAGLQSLGQSASVIKGARVVLTPDTGMMHIAAAFKKPILAMWGNTIPDFGMYPYRTEHINFEVPALSCRPCSKIGRKICPRGHFRCMEDQNVKRMVDKIRILWERIA